MTPTTPTARDFRPDINGLRAWAVAAVVLYHFGVPGFQGGFAGVDVFFVLSGFLMTRLVVGGMQQHGMAAAELKDIEQKYKRLAGFDVTALNERPSFSVTWRPLHAARRPGQNG